MGAEAVTTLLLIRHGETAWNAEHRIQGRLDVPLSTTGVWQAARLAERLAGEAIDAIVSSDLARAWMTGVPLADAHGLSMVAEPRLRERVFGIFEGKTLDEIAAGHPEEFAAWRARDVDWRMPGGESGTEFIGRVLQAMQEIAGTYAGRTRGAGAGLGCAARAPDAQRQHQPAAGAAAAAEAADRRLGGRGAPGAGAGRTGRVVNDPAQCAPVRPS